jgi:hypothetical protein
MPAREAAVDFTPDIDDDMTELTDADIPRVDLVGSPANGSPGWLVMKQDASAGLLGADLIRGLIAKSDPDAGNGRERAVMPNGITVSGSPAAIAALIHAASVRKAKYDADDLKRMAASGAAMPDESYPIGDADDLDKAIRAVGRGGSSHDAIRRHVTARAKSLGKSSMIPDNWNSDGSLKGDVAKEAAVAGQVAKDMGPVLDGDPGAMDALDVTMPLAEPQEMGPGDPTDPGSPAWESIDAATAQKWTSILARAKAAIGVMADREMIEAATADPEDAENAMDLDDACCAIDYAISVLAPFAVGEQSEADTGAMEMDAIGKALAGVIVPGDPLGVIEGLTAVRKAGRVLSAANESAIREAAASLNKVLASLPAAPMAAEVAKEKEGVMPAAQTPAERIVASVAAQIAKTAPSAEDQARDAGPVKAGGTTGLGEPRTTGPAAALPGDGPQQAKPGDVADRTVVKSSLALVYDRDRNLVGVTDAASIVQRVAKADGDGEKKAMQAVFDQDGDLIGIVDPDAIQPVTGAGGKPAAGDDGMQDAPAAAAAPDDGDMTPQPPADAGTPAEDVAKAGTQDVITVTRDVLKSIAQDAAKTALEAQGAAYQEVIAKSAADNGELAEELRVVKARLATVEEHPAAPGVFTNGQVPPANQLRGQDQGSAPVDVAKAAQMRAAFRTADPAEQNRIANEMQTAAIGQLAVIHGRPPQ